MGKLSGAPDQNHKPSLTAIDFATNVPFAVEGSSLLGATYTQIIDNSGTPIVSFGGGTQYTDGQVPPANPIGSTLEWSDGSHWQTISNAQPLPITIKNTSIGVTGTFWQTTQPVSLASVPSHAVTNAGTFSVQSTATSTGGYTPGKLISASGTNGTSIKASAGTLGYITASNINASPRYLKVYNKASTPTVGTDVPVHTFLIPGNTAGAGTNIPLPPQGIALGTGIAIAITGGVADNDSTSVAANDIVINYGYN